MSELMTRDLEIPVATIAGRECREALQLPDRDLPYVLMRQVPDVEVYARDRRDALLAIEGDGSPTELSPADLVQGTIYRLEKEMYRWSGTEEGVAIKGLLRQREIGFRMAGVEQTGLQPPRKYRQISAIAEGMIHVLEKYSLPS